MRQNILKSNDKKTKFTENQVSFKNNITEEKSSN